MIWEVKCKDFNGMLNTLDQHSGHGEQHGLKPDFVPERNSEKIWMLKEMVWTNEISFNFAKKRGDADPKIQISRIKFYC